MRLTPGVCLHITGVATKDTGIMHTYCLVLERFTISVVNNFYCNIVDIIVD